MKVTLQDIAEELKVSAATVSRSLRHDPVIHPETRARVNETALRLGYKGRSRPSRRSVPNEERYALGLLLRADALADAQHDPNLVRMMEGVMAGADELGMVLNVHAIRRDEGRHMEEDRAAVPPMIRDHRCQAIIVQGAQETRDVAYIASQLPVVSLSRIYRGLPVDAVVADNAEGVRALVAHLIELGHRRLAWVHGHSNATFFEARQASFVQGCLGGGLDLGQQRFFGLEIYENRRVHATDELLSAAHDGITALVCANDFVARQVVEAVQSAGLRVPEDISVTGFDALPPLAGTRPLTSIDPHFFEIGRAAARLAAQRLERPATWPQMLVVQGKVVPGESIAPTARR